MRTKYIILILIILTNISFAYADENIKPYKKHSVMLLWENDFLTFMHSDRYYTNGIRLGYTSKEYDYFKSQLKPIGIEIKNII